MKIAVIGSRGQLGSDICKVLSGVTEYEVITLEHNQRLIGDCVEVIGVLHDLEPDVVINTAAFHNVPECENDTDKAFDVNSIGPRNLARASHKFGFHLIHISTDYVFDGKGSLPYRETDTAHPLNAYGNSKLSGENFVLSHTETASILRVSGLYGNGKGHTNFVNKVLEKMDNDDKMSVVSDEWLTPTPTIEVANCIKYLIESPIYGIIHATSEGCCSWFEFAQAIMEITDKRGFSLYMALPGEFDTKVNRPKYSVLGNYVLNESGGFKFPHWRISLEKHLKENIKK